MLKYIGILIAMLVLSVSYAGFSDAVNIGVGNAPNEVTTTEMDWDIIVDCWNSPEFKEYYLKSACAPLQWGCALYSPAPYANVNGTYDKENMIVNIKVDGAYPGYVFATDFCIKNTGNLPSKLKDIEVSYDNAALASYLRVSSKITYSTTGWGWTTKTYVNQSLEDFANAVESDLAGIVFKPGGWICFGEALDESGEVSPDSGASENTIYFFFPFCSNIPEKSNLDFSLKFNFVQFNQ